MYRDDGDQRTREREDSMEDDGRISLWKNRGISILSSSLDSYSFVFFSNCFRAFYMISPRDSKLTLILCIYIYIFVKFRLIFFSFFRLYLIFVADHILKNRSNLRYLRDNRNQSFKKIASDRIRLLLFSWFNNREK